MAGAILSEGQVQISQQAQHFSKVRYRFAAGAAFSQGAVQISRQAQHFRKVRSRFRGRRNTVARCGPDFAAGVNTFARGTNFAAGAALSQGTVQSLTQAQHFRKQ